MMRAWMAQDGGGIVRSPMAVSGSSRMDTEVDGKPCEAVFTFFLVPGS